MLVFPYQTSRQYSDGNIHNWAKIAIFDQYLALGSMSDGASRVVINVAGVGLRL